MTIYYYSWIFGFYFGFIGNIGTTDAANGLIDRDLLLTPKEGLQVHGKSIFYQEPDSEVILRNQSTSMGNSVAWDRTLKHVTFVALFPDIASNGNLSKSKEYEDFLKSPYIKQKEQKHPRFGDIVTLAQGRLEKDDKLEQFHFVEGLCDNLCEVKNILALWQVQKIRHRDRNRKFRYEMKFSIRPWHSVDNKRSDSGKRATSESNPKKIEKSKSFILKDDDYPRSFGRLSYEERETQRRSDDFGPRNFRQTPAEPYFRKIFNIKDFTRGTLPIELPVLEDNLNIGEYVKVFNPRAINLGLLTPTPTTYRPNYHEKFIRPVTATTTITTETDPLPHEQKFKFPNLLEDESSSLSDETHSPIITHHFHHHYYMQRPEAAPQKHLFQSEKENEKLTIGYQLPMTSTTPLPLDEIIANVGKAASLHHFAPFSMEEGEIVNLPKSEVTGKYYRMFPIRIGPELPLIIYPASSATSSSSSSLVGQNYSRKPFVQSEPEEEELRYSDPDPLYENPPDLNVSSESYEVKSSQLESPQVLQHDNGLQRNLEISTFQTNGKLETQVSSTIEPMILKIPTTVNELATIATIFGTSSEQVNTINPLTSTSTCSTTSATTTQTKPERAPTTTTEIPLRTFSVHKIRYGYQRTTTEKPVLRWKPKRLPSDSINQTNHDQYSMASLANSPNITTNQPTTMLGEQIITLIPSSTQSSVKFDQQNNERIEILTQKSVSKSVSVKVGNQLKEIPVTEELIEVSESTARIDTDKSLNNANNNLI